MKKRIWGFIDRIFTDHVGAYAAQAAYFNILSFIPFILFLTTLIRYTPVTYNQVREIILSVVPQNLQEVVMGIVADVYRRNTVLVPVTAVAVLWSAGKGIQAIINGLNTIYHVKETRNWLVNRIISIFYTVLLTISMIVSLTVLLIGERLRDLITSKNPMIGGILTRLFSMHMLPVWTVLFVVFMLLYKFLPNRKAKLWLQIPGAAFTALAWILFSYLFSFYFQLFPNFANMYGSLTALVLAMLWLYFLMNLMLYGALINSYFEKEFRKTKDRMVNRIQEKKKQKETPQEEAEQKGGQSDGSNSPPS